jgi:hypothetical protein
MKITILGPNLRDQSTGQFHVHAAGCRDLRVGKTYSQANLHEAYTEEFTSEQDTVEGVYSDMICENEGSTWEDGYRQDFHWFPCTNTVLNNNNATGGDTMSKTTKTTKTVHNCGCNALHVHDTASGEPIYGFCGATTTGTFAQGHDAKLKGVLLKLWRSDSPYHVADGEGSTSLTSGSATGQLVARGWTQYMVDLAPRRSRSKRSTPIRPTTIKVGRWVYDVVSQSGNVVSYRTKSGELKTTTVPA